MKQNKNEDFILLRSEYFEKIAKIYYTCENNQIITSKSLDSPSVFDLTENQLSSPILKEFNNEFSMKFNQLENQNQKLKHENEQLQCFFNSIQASK